MARSNARMARRARRSADRVTLIVLIAFMVVACITAVLAVIWIRQNTLAKSGTQGTQVAPSETEPEVIVPAPKGPLQREGDPAPVDWDGSSRVTILVMGMDLRDWEDGTDVPRTDSMMLVSIDPVKKTAGLLSIPRDMWVNIPQMGNNKINTAYRWGEVYKLPGGGPGLAMQTVEAFLGVPVQYYAMLDFNAFVRLIDEMGGLDMHIKEEIIVDPIGPGNTVTLQPGVQTLDGATALAYARMRHTDGDDFDRSSRQQEVIMAIRQQVLQFNMLPTLIRKAPNLYQQVKNGVSTNFTLDQIIRLALLGAQIPEENIKKGVIGPPLQVELSTNPEDGQSILIPVPDQIRILRDDVFSSSGAVAPDAVVTQPVATPEPTEAEPTPAGDPQEFLREERARVIVMNGTSTPGLASNTSDMLKSLGVNVIDEDNADQDLSHTTIYVYQDKPNTLRFLKEQLGVTDSWVVFKITNNPPADIEIVLGNDWVEENQP